MTMNFLRFCFLMTCVSTMTFLFCSCGTGGDVPEADMLTPEETSLVVTHIRNVIVKAKNLKLSDADRALVKDTEPRVKVHCTGHKSGKMTVKWSLENSRAVVVMVEGELLDEKPNMRVKILDDISSKSLPDGAFGTHGEEIALPPK